MALENSQSCFILKKWYSTAVALSLSMGSVIPESEQEGHPYFYPLPKSVLEREIPPMETSSRSPRKILFAIDKHFIKINSVSALHLVMNALQLFSTEKHVLRDVWQESNI